jgi:hypothetical protein
VVPTLPAHAVVALWFGFNGNVLSLEGADQDGATFDPDASPADASSTGMAQLWDGPAASGRPDATLQQAHCIAGQNIDGQFSPFTQVAACNAVAFFQAANKAIGAGQLRVPSPGTGKDGLPCLTTRGFGIIDQDQSDNVTTEYLTNSARQIAQDTSASRLALGTSATTLFNGSDNGLLDFFMDPSLGCSPWTVPDLANGGAPATALPLDELQAARWAGQVPGAGPAALVPLNDPMTVDNNGNFNTGKTNSYRMIVDQLPLPAGESPQLYCEDMEEIQGMRLQEDVNLLIGEPSPAPATADNLFTFAASRLQASFVNLKCASFGMTNQVSVTTDAVGVVVAACFLQQVPALTPGAGNPTAGLTICPATTNSAPTAPPGTSPAFPSASSPSASPVSPSAVTAPAATVPSAQVPSAQVPSAQVPSAQAPPTSQPAAATSPAMAGAPTGVVLSRGAHDGGWAYGAAGAPWPGIGVHWGQPNPRRTWLAAVVTGVWRGVLTVFLSATRCRWAPGTVPV